MAAPPTVAAEVDGVISFMSQLREGVPPKESDIAAFSDFFRLVSSAARPSHTVQVANKEPGLLNFTKKVLRGGEAVKHSFDEAVRLVADSPSQVTLQVLRPLRTFSWVLSSADQRLVKEWVGLALSRGASANALAIADGAQSSDGEGASGSGAPSALVPVGGLTGSAFRDDAMEASASPSGAKSGKKVSESEADTKAMVMKFLFKKGARVT